MEDICVVGLGAVGVFYAYLLEKSGKARVTAVCRSNYPILNGSGVRFVSTALQVDELWKPYRAVANCESAADRQYRFVVCCFKALPDVITTPTLIAPLLAKTETFVLIQNGIGIELDLQRVLSTATVISANAWIDTTTYDAGRTVKQANSARLTTGVHRALPHAPACDLSAAAASLQLFGDILRSAGAQVTETNDIEAARWRKVLWNASVSTLCTLTRSSVAETLSEPNTTATADMLRAIMLEVLAAADGAGISSPELNTTGVDTVMSGVLSQYGPQAAAPNHFRPSMLVDLEAGRPIEVEAIVGGVVRIAKTHAVPTPRLDLIYTALKVIQAALVTPQRAA